jgi:hypothetical protein
VRAAAQELASRSRTVHPLAFITDVALVFCVTVHVLAAGEPSGVDASADAFEL